MKLLMANAFHETEEKSSDYLAFAHYLRTGERLTAAQFEQKFNQNHDEIGRFTYAWNNTTGRGGASSGSTATSPLSRSFSSGTAQRRTTPPTRPENKPSPKLNPLRAPPTQPRPTHAGRPLQREGYTPWRQVGSHPAREYRTSAGAAVIDPRSGYPMLVPEGVSIQNTVRVARIYNSPFNRNPAAIAAFEPGGPMDFQRTHSTLRKRSGETTIDQRFIAIGNYNFGVYAAANGMSLENALKGAATVYFIQTRIRGGNPKNERLIVSGYRDYLSKNVGN